MLCCTKVRSSFILLVNWLGRTCWSPVTCRVKAIGRAGLTWNLSYGSGGSSKGKHLRQGKNVTVGMRRMKEGMGRMQAGRELKAYVYI